MFGGRLGIQMDPIELFVLTIQYLYRAVLFLFINTE